MTNDFDDFSMTVHHQLLPFQQFPKPFSGPAKLRFGSGFRNVQNLADFLVVIALEHVEAEYHSVAIWQIGHRIVDSLYVQVCFVHRPVIRHMVEAVVQCFNF